MGKMSLKSYELDKKFVRKMDELDEEDRKSSVERFERSFFRRYNLLIMRIAGELCYFELDSYSCRTSQRQSRGAPIKFAAGRPRGRQHLSKLSIGWLVRPAHLTISSYLIAVALILVSLHRQNQYNYFLFHQQRFELDLARLGVNSTTTTSSDPPGSRMRSIYGDDLIATRHLLDRRVVESRRKLEAVGALLIETSFAGQFFTFCWIFFSFLSYFSLVVFCRTFRQTESYFIGATLDHKAELVRNNSLIRDEVNAFIKSSQNYTESLISRFSSLGRFQASDIEMIARRESGLNKQIADYRSSALSLRSMILAGRLRTTIRSQEHLDIMTRIYFYGNLFIQVNILIIFIGLQVYLVLCTDLLQVDRLSLMDWSNLICMLVLVGVTLFVAVSFTTLFHVNMFDQTELLGRLELVIAKSMEVVVRPLLHGKLGRESSLASNSLRESRAELNEQLLESLLSYRIFLNQLDRLHILFDYIACMSLELMFVTPIVGRIHSPYVSTKVRYLMISWAIYCLFFTLPTVFIACQFNERCLRTYKSLSKLLARVVGSSVEAFGGAELFNQHTLWAFRQTMAHPQLVKERLAPRFLIFSFTYINLIKLVFWYGLIVLSIGMERYEGSGPEWLISKLFSDPLRIHQINFL